MCAGRPHPLAWPPVSAPGFREDKVHGGAESRSAGHESAAGEESERVFLRTHCVRPAFDTFSATLVVVWAETR